MCTNILGYSFSVDLIADFSFSNHLFGVLILWISLITLADLSDLLTFSLTLLAYI
ncbi:hypothetical protein VCRA2122O10_300011 [Vibrio crassostreae]|nr:hypothetical protein VCRA2122O10_300011 [Vibrio crassostreae]